MSKFAKSGKPVIPVPPPLTAPSPIKTKATPAPIPTALGGEGARRTKKSELFLLAVTNFVGEETFHESATARDERFVKLVHKVTEKDPEWVARLVPYLRNELHLRSVSVVVAAEYVRAGGPNGRPVVASALQRADEPGEMLAYWIGRYGRPIPKPVKRGVADAVNRLYTARAVLRYDGTERPWRFGDVIDMVRHRPDGPEQSVLFEALINRRHNRPGAGSEISVLNADAALRALPEEHRRAAIGGTAWQAAGWSWERLAGWLPGGMDAEAWEAVIPNMGYMALLRNLRNFDQAGISDEAKARVAEKLSNPDEVANSKQMPLRFLSAYKEIGSMYWAGAIEAGMEGTLANVPSLMGRTLVLIDYSGSMFWSTLSSRSKLMRYEGAMLFGGAVAKRAEQADVVLFGDREEPIDVKDPLLKLLTRHNHTLGGTYLYRSLARTLRPEHDRVIIVTDEQSADSWTPDLRAAVGKRPVYMFNLAGYKAGGQGTRYAPENVQVIGGLTDKAFDLIPLVETALTGDQTGRWPHMV